MPAQEARLLTRQSKIHNQAGCKFAEHGIVNHHMGEYVSSPIPPRAHEAVKGIVGMRRTYRRSDTTA